MLSIEAHFFFKAQQRVSGDDVLSIEAHFFLKTSSQRVRGDDVLSMEAHFFLKPSSQQKVPVLASLATYSAQI